MRQLPVSFRERRPGENLSPRHIVRGQGEKPLRRNLRSSPLRFSCTGRRVVRKNLSVARADALSARMLNAVCLDAPVDPEVPTTSAIDSGLSVCRAVLTIVSADRQVPGKRALEGAQNLLRIGGLIGAEDDRVRMQRILVRGRKRRE